MLTKSFPRQNSRQAPAKRHALDSSVFTTSFVENASHRELRDTLYKGLRPVVDGLNTGSLTQDQATKLIELLLAFLCPRSGPCRGK